ncbi:hypothetical protein [Ramlibacter rhizophilus]|uniref:Uncharacterized protein n=1 Tax=Ramlibacter rhizophilus TaxID=1781167 RepID=A0A4Z0C2X3_9BURK|nr:hypothetical protein [Ramlibacter rhizophilus]TFZ04820.1 hypothetical protein EZ242_03455 [Ramlibacter rhizophilus]
MQVHSSRPVLVELEELYRIALREHGPQGRSSQLIERSLAQERQGAPRTQQPRPQAARERTPERPR